MQFADSNLKGHTDDMTNDAIQFNIGQLNPNTMNDNCYLMWIIAVIGAGALFGVFVKMYDGFGPNNLRAVGITLVLTFTALIATKYQDGILAAAIGIFGGIAGYLFGDKEAKSTIDKLDERVSELEKKIPK